MPGNNPLHGSFYYRRIINDNKRHERREKCVKETEQPCKANEFVRGNANLPMHLSKSLGRVEQVEGKSAAVRHHFGVQFIQVKSHGVQECFGEDIGLAAP